MRNPSKVPDFKTIGIISAIVLIIFLLFSCTGNQPVRRPQSKTTADTTITQQKSKDTSLVILKPSNKLLDKVDATHQKDIKSSQNAATDEPKLFIYKGELYDVEFLNGRAAITYSIITWGELDLIKDIKIAAKHSCTNRHIQNIVYCNNKDKIKYIDIALTGIKRSHICD